MTLTEIKKIARRAIDDCIICINNDEIGGGYTVCAFCECEVHNRSKKGRPHYKGCLVENLEKIGDIESIE